MIVETGTYYISESGDKVGPMWGGFGLFFILGKNGLREGEWNTDGSVSDLENCPNPYGALVHEWVDLTKITTPFGLLHPAVQKALKNHPGPIEVFTSAGDWLPIKLLWQHNCTYRAAPEPVEPVVETHVMDCWSYHHTGTLPGHCDIKIGNDSHFGTVTVTKEDGVPVDIHWKIKR